MSAVARTFILREDQNAQSLWTFLRLNWRVMADSGKPLAIRVFEYRAKRSDEQNALMWVWLGQIAEQAYIGGRRFDADVWNQHCKEQLLPDETAAGKRKWMNLPNGERRLILSTTDLNVAEMTEYMDKLGAYAATELGVALT